ncbi:MAG TPA: MATE family efflux transporter [Polyangiaceae bacterium]|nr:MATE family efflux transporter [Polyangiaceae bacterium]
MHHDRSSRRILSGHLWLEMARFGMPLALGMGLQTTFNLVDAYLISRLEPAVAGPALGAIGICDQLAALGTIVSYGLSVATAAILSRRYGRGDKHGTEQTAWQSLLVVTGLGVGFGLIGLLGARTLMVDVMGAKGAVAELGTDYLRVLVGGSLTIFLLLHLTTIQRALGSSKTPVTILISANVLNLVLAVLLIYGPGPAPPIFAWGPPISAALGIPRLELMGAAWATLLARLAVLLPLFVLVVRRFGLFKRRSRELPNLAEIRAIWRIGWPSSIQLVVRITAMLMIHSLVARAYTTPDDQTATTALGIVFRLETLALFVGLGWGSAAQTFMGVNLGAANPERAKHSGWYAAALNGSMMAVVALVYRGWGAEIIGFFDPDPSVVAVGVSYLAWVGWSYIGLGIGIVLGAAIQGAGATRQALALDALVVFAFQIPASLLVVFAFDLGHQRLWQVVALTYWTFALVYWLSYRRGRFLQTVVA